MTCDTGAIDDLQCEARAVKAESDALSQGAEDLDKRRAAFETARGDYSKARDEASKTVKELDRRVKDLLTDIKCLLNRDEVECLDQAFAQVVDCLQECRDSQGCCVEDDCGFENETWAVGQIDDLRTRVEEVEKCFDDVLVMEPSALRQRVTDVQKLVNDLSDAMKDEPRDEVNRLYARAKEARYSLDIIWGRFKDVNEFQNCLCRGLACSLRGRQLLAQLAGDQEYRKCQQESCQKRCDWLGKNIVEETLATQLVICPPGRPCGDKQPAKEPARPG
jgi:hypothetical protein